MKTRWWSLGLLIAALVAVALAASATVTPINYIRTVLALFAGWAIVLDRDNTPLVAALLVLTALKT